MSLATNIQNLATRLGTEFKAVRAYILTQTGDLTTLTTSAKTNLVSALNELKSDVDAAASSGGAAINDAGTSTATVWSSSRTSDAITVAVGDLIGGAPDALNTLEELAARLGDDADAMASITAALANRVRVDAAQAFTTQQQDQARFNIGAASSADLGDPATNFVTTFEAGLV